MKGNEKPKRQREDHHVLAIPLVLNIKGDPKRRWGGGGGENIYERQRVEL